MKRSARNEGQRASGQIEKPVRGQNSGDILSLNAPGSSLHSEEMAGGDQEAGDLHGAR